MEVQPDFQSLIGKVALPEGLSGKPIASFSSTANDDRRYGVAEMVQHCRMAWRHANAWPSNFFRRLSIEAAKDAVSTLPSASRKVFLPLSIALDPDERGLQCRPRAPLN